MLNRLLFTLVFFAGVQLLHAQQLPAGPVALSGELLAMVKNGEQTATYETALAKLTDEQLSAGLYNDDAKKTFWINVYNAFIQIRLKEDTSAFKNRNRFFKDKNIVVAGHTLSFDQIEHGILRRSQVKWAGGYLHKWFPSAFEKQQRVDSIDWRIHFALNCGAMSCPAIFYYQQNELNKQLENATNLFLMFETKYDSTANTLVLPKLFSWYRGDFGGKKGIYKLLEEREYITPGSMPKITYSAYDWALSVGNYRN